MPLISFLWKLATLLPCGISGSLVLAEAATAKSDDTYSFINEVQSVHLG